MNIKQMRDMREKMVAEEKEIISNFVKGLLDEIEEAATKQVRSKLEENPYVSGVTIHLDIEREVFGSRWFLTETMDALKEMVTSAAQSIKEEVMDLDFDINFEGRKSANKMNIRIKGSARIIF